VYFESPIFVYFPVPITGISPPSAARYSYCVSELQKLKAQVVTEIRSNQQLEHDLQGMDIKIGLLVRNKITLQVSGHATDLISGPNGPFEGTSTCGVVVITLTFQLGDPGSILGRTQGLKIIEEKELPLH
jgi:hypothetical protein